MGLFNQIKQNKHMPLMMPKVMFRGVEIPCPTSGQVRNFYLLVYIKES